MVVAHTKRHMHEASQNKEGSMADIRIVSPEELQERERKPTGRAGRRHSPERTRIIEGYIERCIKN